MKTIPTREAGRPCAGHRDVRFKNTSVQLAVRFTDRQFTSIQRLADDRACSVAAIVRELIDKALG